MRTLIYYLLTITILIVISYNGACQSIGDSKKHSLSLILQASMAQMEKQRYESPHYGPGVEFLYNYKFRNRISVQTGIDYLFKGGEEAVIYYNAAKEKVGGFNQVMYLETFQIPVQLCFEVPLKKSKKHLNFTFGGGLNYNLIIDAYINPQYTGKYHNISKTLRRNHLGFHTLAGFVKSLNNTYTISVNWQYMRNFTSIYESSGSYASNHTFELGITKVLFKD